MPPKSVREIAWFAMLCYSIRFDPNWSVFSCFHRNIIYITHNITQYNITYRAENMKEHYINRNKNTDNKHKNAQKIWESCPISCVKLCCLLSRPEARCGGNKNILRRFLGLKPKKLRTSESFKHFWRLYKKRVVNAHLWKPEEKNQIHHQKNLENFWRTIKECTIRKWNLNELMCQNLCIKIGKIVWI